MSYPIPTLSQTIAAAQSDVVSRLPGAQPQLPGSVLGALARAQAAAVDGLYGHQVWLADQILYDTADSDNLTRWSAIWGLTREQPTAAAGSGIFTGLAGKIVAAGSQINRADGVQYSLTADVILDGSGNGSGTISASVVGSLTNTDAATVLNLNAPAAGVSSSVTVDANGLGGGADLETDLSLRTRLLARIQQPPQGGSVADFVRWAKTVNGVTRVWVIPGWLGTGTVGVTFTMDNRSNLIPLPADVALVQAAIDAVRPVAAPTIVFAPSAVPVTFVLHLVPDAPALRAQVSANLAALMASECVPGGSLIYSHVMAAISGATGQGDFALTSLTSLTTSLTCSAGQLLTLGGVTWV